MEVRENSLSERRDLNPECTENGHSLTVEKIHSDLYWQAAKNVLLSDGRDNGRHPDDGNKTTLNDGPILYQLTHISPGGTVCSIRHFREICACYRNKNICRSMD